jgi:hypothetical protein
VSEDLAARLSAAMGRGFQSTDQREAEEPATEGSLEPPGAGLDPNGAIERARKQLLEAVSRVAAELETALPRGMSNVLYEALRVEVRPVAERMNDLDALFNETIGRLQQVRAELRQERSERVDDLTLVIDLITTSWRTIDRRLGRIERKLERMEGAPGLRPAAPPFRRYLDKGRRD